MSKTFALSTRFSPVPFTRVRIDDAFWSPRIAVNRERTLPLEYAQLRATGRIEALTLDWKPGEEPVPHIYWESDIAKWIEAASYSLSSHPDADLAASVDATIALLEHAQQPDGYINVYYTVVEPGKRWTNLRDNHELYCAGHLIEAGVAHAKATGSNRLLDIVCRYADYIGTVFGREPGQKRGYCGHEEIELALVKLARHTGRKNYRDLARYFVDERGAQPHYFDEEAKLRGSDTGPHYAGKFDYWQADRPVRELSRVAGHAVRAMYLYSAMADLAGEDRDAALLAACERLWEHLCLANMYISGGIGSTHRNEGFTSDYDLPNETAYAETCAAIGLVYWNQRLLHLDLDSKYADIIERALYNGVISGVSLDGAKFFYENPLASTGGHHRQDWFGCACCPPNLARILASLGDYVYSESAGAIAVNLYVSGSADVKIAGTNVAIEQRCEYPWDGHIELRVTPKKPARFQLRLRIPGWCKRHGIAVNGVVVEATIDKGYAVVDRDWTPGDIVSLTLYMPVEIVKAHPFVAANQGRVALQRGPIVYCLEDVDNPFGARNVILVSEPRFEISRKPTLLGGVVIIDATGFAIDSSDWTGALYQAAPPVSRRPVTLRAIPYATWDNRAPGQMTVWIPMSN